MLCVCHDTVAWRSCKVLSRFDRLHALARSEPKIGELKHYVQVRSSEIMHDIQMELHCKYP